MIYLASLLPVLVALIPFAVILFIIYLINRKAVKKTAIILGILFVGLAILSAMAGGGSNSAKLDTEEQSKVETAAKRNFSSNFVKVGLPNKKTPPFTDAEYIIVVRAYIPQNDVDNFIYDACDKLNNKSTNISVKPLNQLESQSKLIDRSCNTL